MAADRVLKVITRSDLGDVAAGTILGEAAVCCLPAGMARADFDVLCVQAQFWFCGFAVSERAFATTYVDSLLALRVSQR